MSQIDNSLLFVEVGFNESMGGQIDNSLLFVEVGFNEETEPASVIDIQHNPLMFFLFW